MKFYITFILLIISLAVSAQNYKGIWTGYLHADLQNVRVLNVNYILHVKDQNQNIVNGKAYLYRNNPLSAEGILDFIGIVHGNQLRITELKILHSRIPNDTTRFLCIKDLELALKTETGIEYLDGTFTGAGENLVPCYPGNVHLQRFNKTNQGSIPANMLTTILLDDADPNVFLKTKLARPIVIDVADNLIQIQLRDYLREDGDIISVYHNRQPFIKNLLISNTTSNYTLRLNKSTELHEIILYAENLGEIPPNTSNMKIFDGVKEHQVLIQSSKEVSAVIYLRYLPAQKKPSK